MTDSYPRAPRGTAFARLFAAFEKKGVPYAGATPNGGAWPCLHPDHSDEHASLHVRVGSGAQPGRPVFTCAPCKARGVSARDYWLAVVSALGVELRSAGPVDSPDSVEWGPERAVTTSGGGSTGAKKGPDWVQVAVYRYLRADGSVNFLVKRFEASTPDGERVKRFVPKKRTPGGYETGLDGVERTPLNLEHFGAWRKTPGPLSVNGQPYVWFVEGEKAAAALVAAGEPATTFHGGANKEPEPGWFERWFGGFEVRLWPDHDAPGLAWMLRRRSEVDRGRIVGPGEPDGVQGPPWGPGAGGSALWTVDGAEAKDDAYDALKRGLSAAEARPMAPADFWSLEHPAEPVVEAEVAPAPEDGPAVYDVSIQAPYDFADAVLGRLFLQAEPRPGAPNRRARVLRAHNDTFWMWDADRAHYVPTPDSEVVRVLVDHLSTAKEPKPEGPGTRPVPLHPSRTVAPLVTGLRTKAQVSRVGDRMLPSAGGVPFRDGWLEIETRRLHPLTARRDVRWCVPLNAGEGALDAPAPVWDAFLTSIGYGEGTGERRLLRQWMGYVISGRTDLHKGMLLVGATRSGKGTIQKVIAMMVGDGAVGFQLDAFDNDHGTAPLAGATLGTVDDARFDGLSRRVVTGLLTAMSFGPWLFNAKFKAPMTLDWSARLMIATNDTPRFNETSNALANRFVVLNFGESFLGREDTTLLSRLRPELAQIVGWSLEGLKDLETVGKFSETRAGRATIKDILNTSSTVRMFVEERVKFDPAEKTITQDLFNAYVLWCQGQGISRPMTQISFNRAFADAYLAKTKKRKSKTAKGVRQVWAGVQLNASDLS